MSRDIKPIDSATEGRKYLLYALIPVSFESQMNWKER